ncbi:Cytochrome c oxidase assembly protein COX19 [Erysiphe necator]|uniref:Putative cytochrome c oxidase assembly protein cox19 n=1 Tax=Uncinula necator TaxID=52586 RepID=A0A0B1P6L9_UNCNE|nr:Cytochrome c oxidase assembly protein COX19 [Erysiphe necator]KHJ32596.1 putative cytochrome c oxidase assembly protein cox19 [Erysiphe necator]
MSTFGSPGGRQINVKPIPPERGSFPLDHDGECKDIMVHYLMCIKKKKGSNDLECRNIAKSYLGCRMDKNLMAKDEFENLGFKENTDESKSNMETKAESDSKGENSNKGKLLW